MIVVAVVVVVVGFDSGECHHQSLCAQFTFRVEKYMVTVAAGNIRDRHEGIIHR